MNFRLPGGVACALGAVTLAACRAGEERREPEMQLALASAPESVLTTSCLVGHQFGRWIEVAPTPAAQVDLERACALEQAGAVEEAIHVLGEALALRPDVAALYEARGALYFSSGFPRAASGDFQRATVLAPMRAMNWYALGQTYAALTLSRQALEALERAALLGLDTAELHLALARTYRSLGRRGPSAREYELAIARLTRPSTELQVEAAVLAGEEREGSASVHALSEALRSGAEGEDAGLVRALLQESRGEPVETVASFLRVLEVDPHELESLTDRMLTALQLDDPETRAQATERVLAAQLDPVQRSALEQRISQATKR